MLSVSQHRFTCLHVVNCHHVDERRRRTTLGRTTRQTKAARAQQRLDRLTAEMLRPACMYLLPHQASPPPPATTAMAGTASAGWQPKPFHFKIPHGIFLKEATSVAVDADDRVYVFNRGNMPLVVFASDGSLIAQWGNETPFDGVDPYVLTTTGVRMSRYKGTEFVRPHSVRVDHAQNLWLVDDDANCITKCDMHGNRIMMLLPEGRVLTRSQEMDAVKGVVVSGPAHGSGRMFNRPTDIAVHPISGELFISDGYGNSAIHRLRADGVHIQSWGSDGTGPGEFNLPHNIVIHPDLDKVIVADRENSRLQLFTLDGVFVESWPCHRACGLSTCNRGWICALHSVNSFCYLLLRRQETHIESW